MDQVSTNNKVSITRQGKVGQGGCVKQCSEGKGRTVLTSAGQDLHCSFTEEVDSLKI